MNKWLITALLLFLAISVPGQKKGPAKPKASAAGKQSTKPKPEPAADDPEVDRKRFEAALAAPTTEAKAKLLRAFLDDFPNSELREEAFSYLITARAMVGSERLGANDAAGAMESFKLAVEEAPTPVPDRMFGDVILKIPGTLFYSDQRQAAFELASLIERKVAASPRQLLGVAAFYLGIENGSEAKRVAEAALAVDPNSVAAYQALGLAHRLNFELEEAARAYAKAAELEPASAPAKRSLAEMNRALGKPEEAAALYREILAANDADPAARQGLILSLFDAGRQKEAETQFAAALRSEPRNFALLTSVAYWYAANEQPSKAVEYAQKAIDIEPRYVWGHIVLARGLMKQNKPLDAERALLKARQYGNFPTLDYELASARFQAGLYREAGEELQKSFSIRDGMIGTRLGGRVLKEEKSFLDLIGYERKASILEPSSAESAENAEKLRLLFELEHKVEGPADETELAALADEFIKGSDKMKLHRQLYVADLFLKKNVAVAKAAELVKASLGNADSGLDVAAPGAAVMASELYESRTVALSRNEMIVIPEVPRQMLSAILRGRIEELAGWTAFQQHDYPEAIVRLKRSVSVLPDKSAWWRSSMWRLGAALEADGKEKEALESYIKSYVTDRPSAARYGVIESLYRRVNGTIDGLEDKIGINPGLNVASVSPVQQVQPTRKPADETGSKRTVSKTPDPAASSFSAVPEVRLPSGVPAKSAASAQVDKKPEVRPTPDLTASVAKVRSESVKAPEPAVIVEPPTAKAVEPKNDPPVPAADQTAGTLIENDKPIDAPPVKETAIETETARQEPEPPAKVNEAAVPKQDPEPVAVSEKPGPAGVERKAEPEKQAEVKEPPKEVPPSEELPRVDVQSTEIPKSVEPEVAVSWNEPTPQETVPAGSTADAKTAAADAPVESGTPKRVDPRRVETKVPEAANASTDLPAQPVKTKPEATDAEPVNLLRNPFATPSPSVPAQPDDAPPKAAEKPINKPVIVVSDPFKKDERPAVQKQLFEPIIIKVPGNGTQPAKETPAGEASREGSAGPQGTTRRRVIEGKEIVSDQRCSLELSQQSIMLLSGGGSLGLLVKVDGSSDISSVSASSASPADVEVRPEPMVEGATGRRFFVIKSVSERTGVFYVSFESACGKREVEVHVR